VVAAGSPALSYQWRLDGIDGEGIGTNSVGSLAPGQSVPVTFLWNTGGRQFSGAYVPVYAVADSSNQVPEFDESNNDSFQMIPVAASWVPRITSTSNAGSGFVQLLFAAANSSPSDFVIESTGSLGNPISWQPEPGAVITAIAPGLFKAQVSSRGAVRFYHVKATP